MCIDESIILFKQYIPSECHRFGIKMFVMCEVITGFVLDFIIYGGTDTEINDTQGIGISGGVVTPLSFYQIISARVIIYGATTGTLVQIYTKIKVMLVALFGKTGKI